MKLYVIITISETPVAQSPLLLRQHISELWKECETARGLLMMVIVMVILLLIAFI